MARDNREVSVSGIYFITHPEVLFDWRIPVPEWELSGVGLARLEKLASHPWVGRLSRIHASTEKKARIAAERLAQPGDLRVNYMSGLREIDRSAAGTLSPAEYSAVTELFFARPEESIRGWERAVDAQRRIITAVTEVLHATPPGSQSAIVSHGGVGTLLLCHLKNVPIARSEDQPGQGHYFVFDAKGLKQGWRRIEEAGGEAGPGNQRRTSIDTASGDH